MLNDVAVGGRAAGSDWLLMGSRGVGKTVLLTTLADRARSLGYEVLNFQSVAGGLGLIESLHSQASALASKSDHWHRFTSWLSVNSVSINVAGLGAEVTRNRPQARVDERRDPTVLAAQLSDVADAIKRTRPHAGLLLTLDEIQVTAPTDMALLAAVLQQATVQRGSSSLLFAACGLPTTMSAMASAGVTHPDRLFRIESLPHALAPDEAAEALTAPAIDRGVSWEPAAVRHVLQFTQGYPAHLQLVAAAAWDLAPGPTTITEQDAISAITSTVARLEVSTLEPRWDELTDREREYLAAVALAEPASTTSVIARLLGRQQRDYTMVRNQLIKSGDLVARRRGSITHTSPAFAQYVLHRYPEAMAESRVELVDLATMAERLREISMLDPHPSQGQIVYEPSRPGRSPQPPNW